MKGTGNPAPFDTPTPVIFTPTPIPTYTPTLTATPSISPTPTPASVQTLGPDSISFSGTESGSTYTTAFTVSTSPFLLTTNGLSSVQLYRSSNGTYVQTLYAGAGQENLNNATNVGSVEVTVTDANLFLGQSNFHAAGIALSTKKPTYVLDPYFNELRDVTKFSETLEKKATLTIFKATNAQTFGIIVGLKEGQFAQLTALKFKKELELEGKSVQLFAMTDITNDRLKNFTGIDAFIQVACPRISTDNQFDKPVLSTPQATALLKLLRNEEINNYFEIPHWL